MIITKKISTFHYETIKSFIYFYFFNEYEYLYMKSLTFRISILFLLFLLSKSIFAQKDDLEIIRPSSTEIISPIHKDSFSNDGDCIQRVQNGNPRMIDDKYLVFDGAQDGNRQVDPQVAVGGGYVINATNNGILIYTKEGEFVDGVKQHCFNNGIDPKLYFDPFNKVFCFDLWVYWDKEKVKPVNISVSETSDPTAAWNTYPVPSPKEWDGGAIGGSKKWIGYSFPGGIENSFVLKMSEAKSGKPATIYHFIGSLGQPVVMQDDNDDLYFISLNKKEFIINRITDLADGTPVCIRTAKPHKLKYTDYPPQSSQKDTTQKISSGDRNPKNVVFQSNSLWFSQAIKYKGHSAVQWHQISTEGDIIQTGLIADRNTNYIQTTIAVNKKNDVIIGFQEVNENMFVSPRVAYRLADDKPGTVREIVKLAEGEGFANGVAWGDYSGCSIDGDNLMDLWTAQSKASSEGKGHIIIAKIPFK